MKAIQVQNIRPTIESLVSNIKGRPKSSFKTDMKKVYHCPIKSCKYYEDSSFNKIKFLKQVSYLCNIDGEPMVYCFKIWYSCSITLKYIKQRYSHAQNAIKLLPYKVCYKGTSRYAVFCIGASAIRNSLLTKHF